MMRTVLPRKKSAASSARAGTSARSVTHRRVARLACLIACPGCWRGGGREGSAPLCAFRPGMKDGDLSDGTWGYPAAMACMTGPPSCGYDRDKPVNARGTTRGQDAGGVSPQSCGEERDSVEMRSAVQALWAIDADVRT